MVPTLFFSFFYSRQVVRKSKFTVLTRSASDLRLRLLIDGEERQIKGTFTSAEI